MQTLFDLIMSHDNNYHFDPSVVISTYPPQLISSFSFVIPYYENGEIIRSTLKHLYNSIKTVQIYEKNIEFEVIIIDDGSQAKKLGDFINEQEWSNLKIVASKKNQGRTVSRNLGLNKAKGKICFFMDSDIVVDNSIVINALKLHDYNKALNKRNCITVGFFRFTDEEDPLLGYEIITPADIQLNDYRLYCTYGPTWIHCDEDKKFVGQSFSIVHETDLFRTWNGKYKAWVLPLMAMGGFFAVDRKEAIDVGGFNESFKEFGYTETSIPTKLIAKHKDFLIPILVGGGIHVEDKVVNISREEKDRIFKIKHDFYYNRFLKLKLDDAQVID